ALKVLADARADRKERLRLLQVLGEVRQPRAVPALLGVLTDARDDALRAAALTALQPYDDPAVGAAVIGLHDKLTPDARAAAQTLLLSRKGWTQQLLQAVDAGKVDRRG